MAMTVAALIAVVPMAACAQQIDTTVSAPPNARVEIQNFAGTVVVRTWDRPAVRVVSAQGRRDDVRIRGDNGVVSVTTIGKNGVPARRDYEITVPTRAALDVGGTYTAIDIDGARGSVSAATVQGDVTLRGGNGVNKGLLLRNLDGNIAAETVNGSIVLDGIKSADVEAVTVNGRVTYDGTIRDGGRYRFGSHNGTVIITIPERANATIAATTYMGTFSSRFELPRAAETDSKRPRGKANFALGTGSARIEAESFQGDIVLTRPGDAGTRQR